MEEWLRFCETASLFNLQIFFYYNDESRISVSGKNEQAKERLS